MNNDNTTFVSQRQQANDKFKAAIDPNRPDALTAIRREDYGSDDAYISALAQYEYETINTDGKGA